MVIIALGYCCIWVLRALSQAPRAAVPTASVPTSSVPTAPVPWPPFRDQVILGYELDTFTPSAPPLPTSAPCSESLPLPAYNIGLQMEAEPPAYREVEVSDCEDGDDCEDPELHIHVTIRF